MSDWVTNIMPVFSSRSLALLFRSVICFELILYFTCGKCPVSFFFIDIQVFKHCLLRRLFHAHQMEQGFLAPLSKTNSYICQKQIYKCMNLGNSLVVQWLGLSLQHQRVWVWSLVRELRSRMPVAWHRQINKTINK